MNTIKINYREKVMSYWNDGEQYGEWEETRKFYITSAHRTNNESYEANSEKFKLGVDVGSKVYVVYISYDDGDSFGRCSGKGEIVMAYSSEDTAKNCVSVIEKNKEEYSIELETDCGDLMVWSNPCSDWFASFNHVSIETLVVEGN